MKKLNSNHIKFADTFSSPKIKNELIEGVSFLLRNIKPEDANDSSSLAIQCDKALTSLAYNITKGYGSDKEIVDALVKGKDSIYNLLDILK